MTSSEMAVLAEANMLGRICGTGVNGAGDQLRVLLRANPDVETDTAVGELVAGFEAARP